MTPSRECLNGVRGVLVAALCAGGSAVASTDGDSRLELLGLEGRKVWFLQTTGSECGPDCNGLRTAQVKAGLLALSPPVRTGDSEGFEDEAERLRKTLARGRALEPREYGVRAEVRRTVLEAFHDPLHVSDEGIPLLPLYQLTFELTWKGKKATHTFRAREPRMTLRGVWEVDGGRCVLAIVGVMARPAGGAYPDDVAIAVCR